MKFENYSISDNIKQSLEEMGFKKPTDIQFKAIPSILKGEDVLAIAQTGTGKTAAFAIPIIHKLEISAHKRKPNRVRCVVMVPTRELAIQIEEVVRNLAKHSKLSILSVIGGVDETRQIKKFEHGVDMLISTPGRMFDLKSRGFFDFSETGILVLDEADKMLALGFNRDIRDIVHNLPKYHQTLFFSATINEEIKDLAYAIVRNPIRIQLSPKDPVSKNVEHSVAFIEMDDKRFFLERMIHEQKDKKILVFVRTKVRAERLYKAMLRVNIETLTLHGDKEQADRLDVLEKFRAGTTNILIATDISARGIDIKGVDYVVNYDLPDVDENYVHRIGRTGRGFERGQAYSFCADEEREMLKKIETYIGKDIKVMDIDKVDYRMTKALTQEGDNNWKKLLEENEKAEFGRKKRKK